MGKLIRDNIPEIIESSGKECDYHVLNDEDYYLELKRKLLEEVNEFIESDDSQELVDVYEVLLALLDCCDIDMDTFIAAQKAKAEKNGAFTKQLYLDQIR